MKWLLSSRSLNIDLGILLLRLIIGGLFTWHGADALMHYKLYLSMSKSTIGLGAGLEFHLVVLSQLVCGIFIVFGFLARLSIIPIFISMAVAFFIAHKGQAFMFKELPFAYMLLCIPVFIFGSGRFSVDVLIFKKKI